MIQPVLLLSLVALVGVTQPALATVTGQWDFENGDLSATVGTALQSRGDTVAQTQFGTTASFGIANINGQPAKVMKFPACTPTEGFIMTHGAAPNGGGIYVNQYTLILDVLFPSTSTGYGSFLQTDTDNTSDGDLFVDPDNGIGVYGVYQGSLTPDVWHRVAFTVDLTKRELGKFIDGTNVLTGPVGYSPGPNPMQYLDRNGGGGGLDGRWSLYPTAMLFTDENNETRAGYVSSVQFRDTVLTPAQILALGGPTAAGIPHPPAPSAPGIAVRKSGPGKVAVEWTAPGFILQVAPAVTSPFSDLPEATSPYETTIPPMKVFRLKQ